MDAHAFYDADYVTNCVSELERTGADNVGGPWETIPANQSAKARAIAVALAHPFGVGNAAFRTGERRGAVDTVPFGTFRRALFQRLGLFDERLVRNQDIELNSRIRRSGGTVFQSPLIRSHYVARGSLSGLGRNNFRNGLWNIYTSALGGAVLSARHFVPFVFVSVVIAGVLGALVMPWTVWPALAALASYSLFSLAVALSVASKHGAAVGGWLLPVLWCLHWSYGLGSAWGLVTVWPWVRRASRTPPYEPLDEDDPNG
jgi:hypothetical protein